jgi:hypothetical protein
MARLLSCNGTGSSLPATSPLSFSIDSYLCFLQPAATKGGQCGMGWTVKASPACPLLPAPRPGSDLMLLQVWERAESLRQVH